MQVVSNTHFEKTTIVVAGFLPIESLKKSIMKALGIILIVAGILMMVFRSINFTREKKVVDLGPLEINKKEKETVSWPTYGGAIATVAGILILVTAKRRN